MNYKLISTTLILFFLIGCSSSYKELSNNTFDPPDKFSKYLIDYYKEKANFEAKEMHDWNSAKLYSEKALKATKGIRLRPQKIDYWNLSEEKYYELNKSYENLMIVYNNAINLDPLNLAIAISSLDCWAEQEEENWQVWDIEKCKKDFLNAMHNIYNVIEKETNKKKLDKKDSSDSLIVVTKNQNDQVREIIYFDFDKSKLNEVNLEEIKKFINLNKDFIKKYLIVGHTDTKGKKEYNLKLSLIRALTVKEVLLKMGINDKDIKILAEGENKLAVITADEVKHPANRRVEISKIN
ncbi:MAG: Outer membrane porin F [Alphaproteobacteria bacterium MarineAlpha5_Bin9]|nr:MAG: Outer membrane porin F [Alphaproteobacteria bacterium MarineAlpha5_Bin9]|tara:strand:+ start:612 stop:1496 length:885 start_codon:yes stop_codon:yes gene_type:complete